jgi:16S rRNA (cytosine967-C5)-methyltransferase
MGTARSAALRALLRVEKENGYSNLVLDGALEGLPFGSRDRALATAIFYGVLEHRITLDYIIGLYSRIPVLKLSPAVREILRMGVYQIRYLERVPNSAAVNESVKLAKTNGETRAAGFINAVLRALLRGPDRIKLPDAYKEPIKYRSAAFSCPEKLITFWQKAYGETCTDRILGSLLEKPDIFIRVNNTRISEEQLLERLGSEGVKAKRVLWPDNALRLKNPGEIRRLSCYQEGLFHVQDLSSQICCRILDPQPGERAIDVCAAPGGKTFTMAERMENRGEISAFDLYPARVRLVQKGACRLGLSIVRSAARNAAESESSPVPADRVLCDVPCSGLGVIRRKPEIRYKFPSSIDSLPDLQYRILCRSSGLVKKGGMLVYSTCTLNPEENSGVADQFIRDNSDFEPFGLPLPESIRREIPERDNQITLMPQMYGTDGFFIAAFRRK